MFWLNKVKITKAKWIEEANINTNAQTHTKLSRTRVLPLPLFTGHTVINFSNVVDVI